MRFLQAGRGGAMLLVVGLALLEPARAYVAHPALGDEPATVERAPFAAEPTSALATSTPATPPPAAENPSAAPESSPSPSPTATDTPNATPAAIETGLVPIPSSTPKPLPFRVNPGILQYPPSVPIPAVSAQPAGAAAGDEAAGLAGGVWLCRTFAGSVMTHAFSKRGSAPSLAVVTHVPIDGGREVTLHESYAYHADGGAWRATLADGLIEATAPTWNGDTWTFTGVQRGSDKAVDFRMIFTRFGNDVFVRDFQHRVGSAWQTFSGETCRRNAAP